MKIIVIGAGAWGTALAIKASTTHGVTPHSVTLYARDAEQARTMQAQRHNPRYLHGIPFPPSLTVACSDPTTLAAQATQADLAIIATPMSGLRSMLRTLHACSAPVAWLCKGFEAPLPQELNDPVHPIDLGIAPIAPISLMGLMGHEICAQVAPHLQAGVLSGPSFAQEVALGQPTALVAASTHAAVRSALVAALHGPTLRVYASDDLVGVEVGGAVKNVLAIAAGLCDGLHLGLNARAALLTRGLAEMSRLGHALGAHSETFMGLSGLGDLVLTATGDLSRNRRVGLLLAQGHTLEQAVQSLGHVAEGVYSARTVVQRAQRAGVEMPISEAVLALLDGQLHPAQAVALLMGRGPTVEPGG